MNVGLVLFLQLAVANAPAVAPETLAAFAQYESGLDALAIHDNTTGASFHPGTATDAVALASALLAQRHSVDLGLMQVNSTNLSRAGLTVVTAFEPSESIRAGAQILSAAFQQCSRNGAVDGQAALRCAASVYNSGNEQAGIRNGYQARVWKAAALLVPAIQTAGALSPHPGVADNDIVTPMPHRPPSPVFEDALHPTPPIPDTRDAFDDALHVSSAKEIPR